MLHRFNPLSTSQNTCARLLARARYAKGTSLRNCHRLLSLSFFIICSACTTVSLDPPQAAAATDSAAPPAPPPVPTLPPPPQPDPADLAARRLLSYHEQLRQLTNSELAQEVTRLNATITANASAAAPATVLELALVLVQNRANADVSRALTVLDPLIRSSNPDLAPWQPLAKLLSARLSDQRRIEEQLERQTNLLRETQRNLLQTSEKLEALKAIERSLNAKPVKTP
jgi:hypothetical protein